MTQCLFSRNLTKEELDVSQITIQATMEKLHNYNYVSMKGYTYLGGTPGTKKMCNRSAHLGTPGWNLKE